MPNTVPAPATPLHHVAPAGARVLTFDAYRSHVLAVEALTSARVGGRVRA